MITSVSSPSTQGGTTSISGNQVLYTPAADFQGTDTFTYTTEDGDGNVSAAVVRVTVTNVNDAPTAVDDMQTVLVDSMANTLDLLANDLTAPDPGEFLTITNVGIFQQVVPSSSPVTAARSPTRRILASAARRPLLTRSLMATEVRIPQRYPSK